MSTASDVSYHIFRDAIVVHSNGRTVTVSKDDTRYEKVLSFIRSGQLDEASSFADNEAMQTIKELLALGRNR